MLCFENGKVDFLYYEGALFQFNQYKNDIKINVFSYGSYPNSLMDKAQVFGANNHEFKSHLW